MIKFEEVEFIVEANSFEHMCLWKKWHKEGSIDWVESRSGIGKTIGSLDGRPVFLSLRCAKVNGLQVLFWECTSVVVDYAMINDWFRENCNPKCDGGTRSAYTDAQNFHNVISASNLKKLEVK